jgi:hypothetical protein
VSNRELRERLERIEKQLKEIPTRTAMKTEGGCTMLIILLVLIMHSCSSTGGH